MSPPVRCPEASRIHPADDPPEATSVVCGVIEGENRLSPSVHGASDFRRSQVDASVLWRREPGTILGYCCSEGYVNCPVWRAHTAKRAKRGLVISAADTNYGGVGNRD